MVERPAFYLSEVFRERCPMAATSAACSSRSSARRTPARRVLVHGLEGDLNAQNMPHLANGVIDHPSPFSDFFTGERHAAGS